MEYKYAIKAARTNNLTNARFFSSQLVDWIGLDLDPVSPGNLKLNDAEDIVNWLAGVNVLGEFDNRDADEVKFLAEKLNLKAVEVPYGLTIDDNELTVFSKLTIDDGAIPMAIDPGNAAFLVIDLPLVNGVGEITSHTFDAIKTACEDYRVFLGANYTAENVKDLVNAFEPYGINLFTEDEMGLGMNDFDEIKAILDQLK